MIDILSARGLSDAHREQVIEDTLRGAPDAKRAWPERGMVEDVSQETSKIEVPIRVILGSADKIESETSLRLAFEKVNHGTRFTILTGIGHLAPLEAASDVAGAIRSSRVS